MRIITCSNSAVRIADSDLVPAGPGGVVPMVAALIRRRGGDWIFPDSTSVPGGTPARRSVTVDAATTTLHPLPVEPALSHQHHDQISIRVLQWLFHYLHDTPRTPLFDHRAWQAWDGYRSVNHLLARQVEARWRDDPGAVVLVNDHQLMLVPAALRRPGGGTLAYFHQLPWCQSDYFGILPHRVRTEILASLLACDVVGFHARRWADAFGQCCQRYLPDVDLGDGEVRFRGRPTRVVVAPGPVDEAALARVRADPATDRWRDRLAGAAHGRRMLVRAERFDLWKNVRRGLMAFEQLLEGRPALAGEVWHCALLSWPRRPTVRHRRDWAACEAVAARINDRYPGEPVALLPADGPDNTQHRVVAALEAGAATLVNPTYDGLNLVALESLLLAPAVPVVLSVNAGGYEVLAPHTRGVDPFDVVGTAGALDEVLERPGGGAVPDYPTRTADGWLAALLP